jgi:hypothetical protein
VFKDNLLWGNGTFRTAFIDPMFYDNVLKIRKKMAGFLWATHFSFGPESGKYPWAGIL